MSVPSQSSGGKLNGRDLVGLSQGFSCIFWGLPVGLLFVVQLLILDVVVADPVIRASLNQLYLTLLLAALGAIVVGAFKLGRIGALGESWVRRARIAATFAVLLLYFSPFLYWWRVLPDNTYYTLNVFGMIYSVVVFLITLNILGMELGRFLGDRSLWRESRLFLGLNAVVLAIPSSGAFVWAALRSLGDAPYENFGHEFLNLFRLHYPWRLALFVVLFLPVSLTLANLWRVKGILLDELKKLP